MKACAKSGREKPAVTRSLDDLARLAQAKGERAQACKSRYFMPPGHMGARQIEFRPDDRAPAVRGDLATALKDWTGTRWVVTVAREGGGPTLAEQRKSARAARWRESCRSRWCERCLTLSRRRSGCGAPDTSGPTNRGGEQERTANESRPKSSSRARLYRPRRRSFNRRWPRSRWMEFPAAAWCHHPHGKGELSGLCRSRKS